VRDPNLKLLTLLEWHDKYPDEYKDFSTHKTFTCVNHQGMRYSSKNPLARNTFVFETDMDVLRYYEWHFNMLLDEMEPKTIDALVHASSLDCDCTDRWYKNRVLPEMEQSPYYPDNPMRYIDEHANDGVVCEYKVVCE